MIACCHRTLKSEYLENIIAYRTGLDGGFANFQQLSQVQGMTESILKKAIDQLQSLGISKPQVFSPRTFPELTSKELWV